MINYQQIAGTNLSQLQAITSPYASSAQHVQGPGGNTSVKDGNVMLLKASGFTFKNVAEDTGVVLIEVPEVLNGINSKQQSAQAGVALPVVLASLPEGGPMKASMEYEFHALLGKFVLHTHSVASNVLNCSQNVHELYEQALGEGINYDIVPYVTPGYPIAAALLDINKAKGSIAPVIFLQNHGVIIHADTADAVTDMYNYIEQQLYKWLQSGAFTESVVEPAGESQYRISNLYGNFDYANAVEILENEVLIPDQTIFFKDKVSTSDANAPVYINTARQEIIVNGGEKFANACAQMLQAVQFVRSNQQRLNLKPEYLATDAIAELHNLPAEKHRTQLLKN